MDPLSGASPSPSPPAMTRLPRNPLPALLVPCHRSALLVRLIMSPHPQAGFCPLPPVMVQNAYLSSLEERLWLGPTPIKHAAAYDAIHSGNIGIEAGSADLRRGGLLHRLGRVAVVRGFGHAAARGGAG